MTNANVSNCYSMFRLWLTGVQAFVLVRRIFLFKLFLLGPFAFGAGILQSPIGDVLLEVSGSLSFTNTHHGMQFDREMLLSFRQVKIITSSPWESGINTYVGPKVSDIFERVGASGSEVRVTALNGYKVTISEKDIRQYDFIIALSKNGEKLTVRERGPLFLIYSFDDHPDAFLEHYLNRKTVWQVSELIVR